jgi:uncharacterized phiE125 gp8 family phage protein
MLAQLIIAGVYDSAPAPGYTGEPVTLIEIKRHLDIVRNDQDDMLLGMIVAAREWVENYTGLILTARDVAQGFDRFGCRMTLNAWPIRSATGIVTYLDANGAEQILPAVPIARWTRPARLPASAGVQQVVAYGEPIVVTVPAGYATPADVPYSLKAAISLIVGDLYNQREETAVGVSIQASGAVTNLCHPYRMPVIG